MKKKAITTFIVFILIIEFLTYSVHADNQYDPFFYEKNETASRMLAGASSVTGLYYPDNYNNKEKYDIIDVSVFQGDIDWNAVRSAGVTAAIVRLGYRGYEYGNICTDGKYATNLVGAKNAGLKVGAYFYSSAINENEAIEEANFAANLVRSTGVQLDLPLYIDFEGSGGNGNWRVEQNVNQSMGTNILREFCNTVKSNGYIPGIYAGYYFLGERSYRDTVVSWKYSMWLAWYSNNALYNVPYTVDVWQYTGSGRVNGISGNADRSILFIDKPGKCTNLTYTMDPNDTSKAVLRWDYINNINDYTIEITQGGRTTTKDVQTGGLILAANTMTAKVDLVEGTNKFRIRAKNKKFGFEEIGDYSDYVTIQYEKSSLKGDIDGNGTINLADALKLRRYIANSTKWNLTNDQKSRADVNEDGIINLQDALKLRRYIAANSNESIRRKHTDWVW